MVQVRVLGIALDASQQHLVLLKPLDDELEPGAPRVLPIWIGAQEATSILIALEGERAPRPLSHDLITTLFATVDARIERVDVTRIESGTFYAELTLTTPSGRQVVDARPSDAVALALRAAAPIFVADEVLDDAGIPAEFAGEDDGGTEGGRADEGRDDEAKLAEFKEFLDDVDPEDFQG
ncbi:bifunctional nuclease family protein [Agromyces lapidis]|uniref:Bifunctional nuclease family protein n=1 Tax=Agromyces lapidis TaxID=279574 RepID=A0ABV5SSD8_9MICO|nr:bifunctional nuclease family protein [Agromyces lapidis]